MQKLLNQLFYMRLTRIYQAGEFSPGQIISLSPSASQHIGRVLRMRPGENIIIFNGKNLQCSAKILKVDKRSVDVKIEESAEHCLESELKIHLAQGISKGNKMDIVVQKAVELGVYNITPILTERCNVNIDAKRLSKKQIQWQEHAIAACEQSGRNYVPNIENPCNTQEFIEKCSAKHKFVLSPTANKTWRDYTEIDNSIALLIGPEGGLSMEEIKLAESFNFQPLSLGPRILRTETAAISSISIIQALFGDL